VQTRVIGVLSSAILLSLTSCIPIPHVVQDLPRVSGTVTEDGKPLSGVVLQVTDVTRANPCARGERRATTDADGRFVTAGRRRPALWVALLPFHSVDTWAVALIRDGVALGYVRPWNYRAGMRYSPREVEMSCELEQRTCAVHNKTWDRRSDVEIRPCSDYPPRP
jgi:hypothetical protein